MTEPDAWLPPGTLADRLAATAARALASGALQPIVTHQTAVQDWGVRFLVRMVDSLARKEAQRTRAPVERPQDVADPFLPPDPLLRVGVLSDTHMAVLNKFNVLPCHLLMVTRRFESQETLLGPADLEAFLRCLREIDGLGFFNGGTRAGASQTHKHLQLVPLPLADDGPAIPMEDLLLTGKGNQVATPPFSHAFAQIDTLRSDAGTLHRVYMDLIGRVGIQPRTRAGAQCQSDPYNLLVTRRWMLAVPRPAEGLGSVSVNALGFAGSLFVRDRRQLDETLGLGPMRLLCAAAGNAGAL